MYLAFDEGKICSMDKIYTRLFSFIFSFFLVLSFLDAQSIERGPYLQMGTSNSMIIKWRTSEETTSKVWFGATQGILDESVEFTSLKKDHEVLIEGLAPATKYFYAIGKIDSLIVGNDEDYYFVTSPNIGDSGNYRVWLLGDCGRGEEDARNVRDAYYDYTGSQHTDLIFLLGDNAYESGEDYEYQDAVFENSYEEILTKSVLWPCPGNHDYKADDMDGELQTGPYYDIFSLPKNGEAGGTPSNTEAYYSFDYGNIHVISLDSHDQDRDPGSPMLEWLEEDLANSTQMWKVVFFHHPPYTKGSHDSDDYSDSSGRMWEMRQFVVPIFEKYKVDLVLSGHSHVYERSYLVNGHYEHSHNFDPSVLIDDGDGTLDGDGHYSKRQASNGTVYVVSGSSSKQGNGDLDHPIMFYGDGQSFGSAIMEVTGNQMRVEYLHEDGIVKDHFVIEKDTSPCPEVGTPCDDENENTINDIFTLECDCRGTSMIPITICKYIANEEDDAEENGVSGRVDSDSKDLELTFDTNNGDSYQIVGLRYPNMNIPPGVNILEAKIQFTVDEKNSDSTSLQFYAETSTASAPFVEVDNNLTNRSLTSTFVNWNPPVWEQLGASSPNQLTPDLSSIIQEVLDQDNYSKDSPITIIIKGTGERTADSFEGGITRSAKLCITYSECLPAGTACDDFNDCSFNDIFDDNCNCAGTLFDDDNDGVCNLDDICPGFDDNEDEDEDGIPDACDDCNANLAGMTCDDQDQCTINDVMTIDCDCVGTFTDSDEDGVCDGEDLCPGFDDSIDADNNNIPDGCQDCNGVLIGLACDDQDPCTIEEVYDANCDCVGMILDSDNDNVCDADDLCPGFDDNEDEDGDGIPNACDDCNENLNGTSCNDNDECTNNDVYDSNCNCLGSFMDEDDDEVCDVNDICPGFDDNEDEDEDGIPDGCDECNGNLFNEPCNDNDFCTENDVFDADCNCAGIFADEDADGVCNADDLCPGGNDNEDADNDGIPDFCDDCDNNIIGTSCDDNEICTINDVFQSDCSCSGTFVDADNDGICLALDEDDNDPCFPDLENESCIDFCRWEDEENFESNYGLWNSGGNDGRRVVANEICSDGVYCVRLRNGNGAASSVYTNPLAMTTSDSLIIAFSYFPTDMEDGEKLYLETSTDNGGNFSVYRKWEAGIDFQNFQHYETEVTVKEIGFSESVVLRLRCEGTDFTDAIYLDEMKIEVCDTLDVLTTLLPSDLESAVQVQVFPNPIQENQLLQVQFNQAQIDLEIFVTDIIGSLIHQVNLPNIEANNPKSLPIKIKEAGIYIITIKGDNAIYAKKISVIK